MSAVAGSVQTIPGIVEGELYDEGAPGVAYHDTSAGSHGQDYDQPPSYPPPAFRQPTNVDIYKSTGYSNGYLIVMQAGDWMNYTVDVAQSGTYTLEAQTYYWGAPGGTFHVEVDGVDKTGQLRLPGGSNWQTVTKAGVQLAAGRHVLKVVCDSNGSDGQYMGDIDFLKFTAEGQGTPYTGAPLQLPGTVEAEYFNNGGAGVAYHDLSPGTHGQDYDQPPSNPPPTFRQPTDVDIYKSTGYSNGYLVLSHAGEWMKYTVNVASSGTYTLEARVAWGGTNGVLGTFHVEMDGVNVTGPIQIPDTEWSLVTVTKSGVRLTAGPHTMRVVADTNAGNGITGDFDYFRFVSAGTVNHALGKSATQVSTYSTAGASRAADGNTDGSYYNNSVTHTLGGSQEWWQVDLGGSYAVETIKVWNRTDCCAERLSNFYVFVSDAPYTSTDMTATLNQAGVSAYHTAGQGGTPTTINVNRTGRYVRVQLADSGTLSLAEVQVLGGATTEPPAGTSSPAEGVTVINFDDLPNRTAVTSQYPGVVFSSGLNRVPAIYDVIAEGAGPINANTQPRALTRKDSFWGTWDHFAPLTVDFTRPVNNLKFFVCGISSFSGTTIAQLDVYQNNAFSTTINIRSFGFGYHTWIFLGPSTDFPNGLNNVTRIVIRPMPHEVEPNGIDFDDFSFTPVALERVDITNPRVGGSLNNTTQNAMPAADIRLQANITPSGLTGGSYSWSFTGPVSISGGATNSSAVTIRAQDVGAITARVTYTLDGTSVSGSVNINSALPRITAFNQSQGSDRVIQPIDGNCANLTPVAVYRLGCVVGNDPGAQFSATAQPPGNFISEPSQSGIKFVQSVNALRKRRYQGNTECLSARTVNETNYDSGWMLDGSDPYGLASGQTNNTVKWFSQGSPSTITAFDFPQTTPGGNPDNPDNDDDAHYVDDRFEMYVFYFAGSQAGSTPYQRPLGLQNSQLPYARLAWKWGGQIVYGYNPSLLAPYERTFTNQPPTSNSAVGVASVKPLKEGGVAPEGLYPWSACPGGDSLLDYTTNPIDWTRFFAEQHYRDFLGREADRSGSDFWTSNITRCAFDKTCIDNKRVDVSRAFFYSGEFIGMHPELGGQRGTHDYNAAFVLQCYRTYLGREPNAPPDNNWDGYNYWVGVLDSTNPNAGDYKYNQLIRAFLLSTEYRRRFGIN